MSEALGFGVDDDCGAIGGGVEGRTGWSPAFVDGTVPAEASLLGCRDESFELTRAAEAVEEVAAAGAAPETLWPLRKLKDEDFNKKISTFDFNHTILL